MENSNQFDHALIAVYRQQSAPTSIRRELIEQFEASSRHGVHPWRYATFAVIAICVVTGVRQIYHQSVAPGVLPAWQSISLSTASFHPLPSLSRIKLDGTYKKASPLNLKSVTLTGKYRKTINLTNKLL